MLAPVLLHCKEEHTSRARKRDLPRKNCTMAKLVECVPNFSEGRNKEVIDAIADAISQTEGCLLLDVDAGPSTNRTVYTFVGSPNAVIQGALCAARIAFQLIDMTKHKGEHPRMGALDVCPFIPVKDVSMEECVFCARRFGQQLASELEVPVYLYAEAAQQENRKSLPAIRLGQYEALPEKLKTEEWMPDFGPATFVPRWGATVSGARKFLIAYNVNLLSTKELAHRIALDIREQGRGKDQPGCLKKVQAISWYLDEKNLAQVSANLLDFETTGLHGVYEEVCKEAKVISRLGLDSLGPFNPKERIVEYIVQKTITEGSLVTQPLFEFVQNVGSRSATPGGGSVSAAVAAMGSALGCMVGLMTYGKRQFEFLDGTMRQLILPFHNAMTDLLTLVDADSNAFNNYMVTTKLSRATTEEKIRREVAVQEGLKNAIGIPLSVAEKVNVLWPTLKEMGKHGNIVCKSDLQVAAKALETAVFGAYFNVLINLKDVKDDEFKAQTHEKISGLLDKAKAGAELVLEVLEKRTE
ncbi:formimidoyltransferase-cyclodeaminase isoform X3 [Microcaecilia unicolor]|uniref:Formimidoyltransferase-cyclodeaminase n=1 Tax=Microcaecilia unicolor TaxID=1415580 RepID=A0A6P7YT97_9AMPH|nr:formimidoyltransferase-cyclodeaminase isoform X3 [Microcaecilia unicolor]